MSAQELEVRQGRPPGYPKSGGRKKGTKNKNPEMAQRIANKHSPDAVEYLVKVMKGQRFSQGRKTWIYPSPHTRTVAAVKLLDVAEMPVKRGMPGQPLLVNIQIGTQDARSLPEPIPVQPIQLP